VSAIGGVASDRRGLAERTVSVTPERLRTPEDASTSWHRSCAAAAMVGTARKVEKQCKKHLSSGQ
jgi:hypothetical protein